MFGVRPEIAFYDHHDQMMSDVNRKRQFANPAVPFEISCVKEYERYARKYDAVENPHPPSLQKPCVVREVKDQEYDDSPKHQWNPVLDFNFPDVSVNLVREASQHEQRYLKRKKTVRPRIPRPEVNFVHIKAIKKRGNHN